MATPIALYYNCPMTWAVFCMRTLYITGVYYGGCKQKQGEWLRMNSHHLPVLILDMLRGNGHLFLLWIFFILPLGSS